MADRIKLPAIKGIIGDWVYYQTVISFGEVVNRVDNDRSIREYPSLDDVLQRDLSSRSQKIAAYLCREETRFFNSVILGLFGGAPNWYSFDFAPSPIPEMTLDENFLNTIGVLELSGREILFSIDGQHRIEGIKQALSAHPDAFKNDELAVIIVAHDDTRDGKRRTRRLFSEINTKALKVSGLDDLITNEDNPIDINTRRLYADFEPFNRSEFIALSPKASIAANSLEFTTILNLRSVNKILYSEEFKFNEVRPSDKVIEDLYQKSLDFWHAAVANISAYQRVMIDKSSTVHDFRNINGGSLLFRPIGIELLAEVYLVWANSERNLNEFWDAINRIDTDLASEYWKDIVWDNAKKTIKPRISMKFIKNYCLYLLGLDYDENYTLIEYNKLKGMEDLDVANLEPLPDVPY